MTTIQTTNFQDLYAKLQKNDPDAAIQACNLHNRLTPEQQKLVRDYFTSHAVPPTDRLVKDMTICIEKRTFQVNRCWLSTVLPLFEVMVGFENKKPDSKGILTVEMKTIEADKFAKIIEMAQNKLSGEKLATDWSIIRDATFLDCSKEMLTPFDMAFAALVDEDNAAELLEIAKEYKMPHLQDTACQEILDKVIKYFHDENESSPTTVWLPSQEDLPEEFESYLGTAQYFKTMTFVEYPADKFKLHPQQILWILDQKIKDNKEAKLDFLTLEHTTMQYDAKVLSLYTKALSFINKEEVILSS